jgi:very-short-patch-repair endonuclease
MTEDLRNYGQERQSWRERINQTARELRKNQTESEKIFWELVRGRKLSGIKFLRQYPITYSVYQKPYFFFADFYCAKSKLIIEIDGSIHDVKT